MTTARRNRTSAMLSAGLLFLPLLLAAPARAAADGKAERYLSGSYADLGYDLARPPRPESDEDRAAVDLDQVRAAQYAGNEARQQAFADADAFGFEALMPRFSEAAGVSLTIERRPVLAHMLRFALGDAGAYGHDIKAQFARDRPYVVDPSIQPCALSYLRSSDARSYPSGHSTNGYLAALLIADVIPGRGAPVMARGTRYGTNRVICGAHFPSDVAAGQMFARFLYRKIAATPAYRQDLACARLEADADEKGRLPALKDKAIVAYDPPCNALASRYRDEMTAFGAP